MKKVLLSILIVLLLISNVFATDWFSYVGKNVKVCTISECYIGKVENVFELEVCMSRDMLGNCLWRNYLYTLFLRLPDRKLRVIRCEAIQTIEEINGK